MMGAGFRDAALDTARNQRTASCRLHIQITGQLKAHGDKRFQAETGGEGRYNQGHSAR